MRIALSEYDYDTPWLDNDYDPGMYIQLIIIGVVVLLIAIGNGRR